MNEFRLLRRLALSGVLLAGTPAQAAVFRCVDGAGASTYQATPCTAAPRPTAPARSEPSRPAAGDPDGLALWETVTVLLPRVRTTADTAWPGLREPSPETSADEAVKVLQCSERSPIEDYLAAPALRRCRAQIAAQGGACVVEEDRSDGRGSRLAEVRLLDGNYRTELRVVSRLSTISADAPGVPVTDEVQLAFTFLGECRPGMQAGDSFRVEPRGGWVKLRRDGESGGSGAGGGDGGDAISPPKSRR